MNLTKKLLIITMVIVGTSNLFAFTKGPQESLNFEIIQIQTDTIPVENQFGDFLTDPNNNPFDIKPSNLEQKVEYDPESNSYVIFEKIGEEYYKTPVTMTFNEYLEWRSNYEEKRYFNKLAGVGDEYKSKSGIIDPISRVDIKDDIVDRLFGGQGVTIKPQGNIDLTILPLTYNFNGNPNIFADQQDQYIWLDFDPVIQMNVDGGIGDKMDLNFNFNTQSTFDFDQKIKLAYDSEEFNEDDIIKKIEAGNVSMPLRSNLIQGAQQLLGLKTEVQFGHLRLTALAAEQKSSSESLQIQNGAQVQEFQIRPDEYDENRHFFISHFHRDNYESTLENLPYLNTAFRINRIQVWISNDRPEFQENSTRITAITDLGEGDPARFTENNQTNSKVEEIFPYPALLTDINGQRLPDNRSNSLYFGTDGEANAGDLILDEETRLNDNNKRMLELKYGLEETEDFERFRGRLLSPSEYSFNPELGFISLNIRLKPNQVLGVAYDYYYTYNCDTLYSVGELSEESTVSNVTEDGEIESESVIYVKLLKNTEQVPSHPTWDLMMKNVYALRTNSLNQRDFSFDIFYEDDFTDGSLKKFIPLEEAKNLPLLNMFNLDRLNSRNDRQPDGVFDFVPGVTVIPRNGSIIFPKLEPFGNALDEALLELDIEDEAVRDRFVYQQLYDSTLFQAQENLEFNKFVMMGEYKSEVSSEISLGAWNLPPGSLRVRAGSQLLVEGVDYEVDYGVGRLRILNEAYLQQGVPLDISYEDSSLFSIQQKVMMGLRADYALGDYANIGATYLRLSERPYTQKVNIGDDPINNRIFGLDFDYSKEAPWITKLVDKLPIYSTNAPSNILFTAEVAALKPGHRKVIELSDEEEPVVNIDDFEGAITSIPLGTQTNRWNLSSVPTTIGKEDNFGEPLVLAESQEIDNLTVNANRAMLNWYVIDRGERQAGDNHSYARAVVQSELFNRTLAAGQLPDIYTFDLSYYPTERGPYNFDSTEGRVDSAGTTAISSGVEVNGRDITLKDPASRWGGITRYMQNSDFQSQNYEFIDFWMMNPYMEKADQTGHNLTEEGKLVFHLGNVSEDVMKDGRQFYENGLPTQNQSIPIDETNLGVVSIDIPVNNGFEQTAIEEQDLGYDGLDDASETNKFSEWINELGVQGIADPSNDNFLFYGDASLEGEDLQRRYRRFNSPQGNSPRPGNNNVRGNPIPESEDLNNNQTLDEKERYFEYVVDIKPNLDPSSYTQATGGGIVGEIDTLATKYITETKTITNTGNNNVEEKWYRFRIPLKDTDKKAIGGIEGFRSIQFMRLITTGFETSKTMRMADFELVRNQWRAQEPECGEETDVENSRNIDFSIDVVGVEENSQREPFGYVTPRGIQQEQLFTTFAQQLQDERSLSMNFCNMVGGCEVTMYKLTELDLRFFENLQLFVHAEQDLIEGDDIADDSLSMFIRIGKDFENNYYEYEIPLTLSREGEGGDTPQDRLWRIENMLDVDLKNFTELKKERNSDQNASFAEVYESKSIELPNGQKMSIIGNPTLGFVKGIQIGVRNNQEEGDNNFCGQVWVNELRAAGFKERGGVAGLARLDVQMADLGNTTVSGSYSSVGFGGLDQKLAERSLDEIIEYDVATNLQLGKFLPANWKISVPFYAQYAKSIKNPLYDPYALDLTVDEVLDLGVEPRETVLGRSQDATTIKTLNFINVRKERTTGGAKTRQPDFSSVVKGGSKNEKPEAKKEAKEKKPMPWDISNWSASYSYTEINHRDEFLSVDDSEEHTAELAYVYTNKFKGIKPFDKIANKPYLKVVKELNFNPVPGSFSFNTSVNRYFSTRVFRLPETPLFEFDDRNFDWSRRYNLKWDLMKNLKMTFTAENRSVIDELRQSGIGENKVWLDERGDELDLSNPLTETKSYWQDNFREGGRNTDYSHQIGLNYTLPTTNIRILNWISIKASYRADYSWIAGPLININSDPSVDIGPGAIIQNAQDRSVNGTFNFDKLYSKSKYLKRIESGTQKATTDRRRGTTRTETRPDAGGDDVKKEKKQRDISKAEMFLVRPLLSLRTVKFNYKESLGTLVPGFMETPKFFGLADKWSAPGWQFVSGLQPNLNYDDDTSFLRQATDNGWMNPSREFNQQLSQNERQNFEANVAIEPWKYFKIDVDFSKRYNRTNTREFKNKLDPSTPEFNQFAINDIGSFEVSYLNFRTLFDNDVDGMFQTFLSNRAVISERLDQESVIDPVTGDFLPIGGTPIDDSDGTYREGFRKTSTQVMIPAFLSTYTGTDINDVPLDIEQTVRKYAYIPAPNWRVSYDGLTKMPRFKEIFQTFSIEHAYRSTMGISQFRTDPLYQQPTESNPFASYEVENINVKTGNYYSRLDIPSITISEQFSPLIGIRVKTKSDFLFDVEYRKSRDLDLTAGINGAQLQEVRSTGVEAGIGYTFKNVVMFQGKKKKTRSSRTREDNPNGIGAALDKLNAEDKADEDKDDDPNKRGKRGVNDSRGNDLICNFDFSYRDDLTLNHKEALDDGQAVRGTQTLSFEPSVEYEVNKNFALRSFMSYRMTTPYATTQYPSRNFRIGITLRFKLD